MAVSLNEPTEIVKLSVWHAFANEMACRVQIGRVKFAHSTGMAERPSHVGSDSKSHFFNGHCHSALPNPIDGRQSKVQAGQKTTGDYFFSESFKTMSVTTWWAKGANWRI